jgi:hypothetical protein
MREAKMGKMAVPGQPGQKRWQDPISIEIRSWVWWYMPVIPAKAGSVKLRIMA